MIPFAHRALRGESEEAAVGGSTCMIHEATVSPGCTRAVRTTPTRVASSSGVAAEAVIVSTSQIFPAVHSQLTRDRLENEEKRPTCDGATQNTSSQYGRRYRGSQLRKR